MGKKSRQKRQKEHLPKVSSTKVQKVELATETALGSRLAASGMQNAKVTTTENYSHVRGEIKKILLYMAVVVVMLSSAVILNTRSSILKDFGGNISSFLQLQ